MNAWRGQKINLKWKLDISKNMELEKYIEMDAWLEEERIWQMDESTWKKTMVWTDKKKKQINTHQLQSPVALCKLARKRRYIRNQIFFFL